MRVVVSLVVVGPKPCRRSPWVGDPAVSSMRLGALGFIALAMLNLRFCGHHPGERLKTGAQQGLQMLVRTGDRWTSTYTPAGR